MGKRIKSRGLILKQLPTDIIDEILYKLPVKSLLRFKCVSKPWRSLISSNGFAREHLNKSKSATDFAHHNIIFRSRGSSSVDGSDYLPVERFVKPGRVGSCSIGPLLSDHNDDYEPNPNCPRSYQSTGLLLGDDDAYYHPNPSCLRSNQSIPMPVLDGYRQDIYLLGSCDGLILISNEEYQLYLWNPSTRKAKNILNASFPKETHTWGRKVHYLGCGLGYNELTNDYKVVGIFFSRSHPGDHTLMYSSKTDSWKKIRSLEQRPRRPATFVNGKLHWLTQEGEERNEFGFVNNIRWNIVSLDLVVDDENYQIIAPPPNCDYSNYYDHHHWPVLGELGGYLSFIYYNRTMDKPTMDAWVMKKESWSKIWTFSDQIGGSLPRPIWLKKNGDVVVTSKSNLVVYHGKDKLRQSQSHNKLFFSEFESIVYVESLAAPISDDKQLLS